MKRLAATLFLAAGLSACGGGGGNPGTCFGSPQVCGGVQPPPGSGSSPVGLFKGSTGSGRTAFTLVLPDQQIWLLYTQAGSATTLAGAAQGTYLANNGSINSGDLLEFSSESTVLTPATLAGSYVPETSISGTLSFGGTPFATFTGAYDPLWELQGTTAAAAGTYTGVAGTVGESEAAVLTVAAAGAISGSTASGCDFGGTLTPGAGFASYAVRLNFTGAACGFATPTFDGVAILEGSRLYIGAFNLGRSQGVVFSGAR